DRGEGAIEVPEGLEGTLYVFPEGGLDIDPVGIKFVVPTEAVLAYRARRGSIQKSTRWFGRMEQTSIQPPYTTGPHTSGPFGKLLNAGRPAFR
ncbi:MAG: hypothetical protein GY953_28690, partial [bacterium]|nr:hypothetical protein [bacterium]